MTASDSDDTDEDDDDNDGDDATTSTVRIWSERIEGIATTRRNIIDYYLAAVPGNAIQLLVFSLF